VISTPLDHREHSEARREVGREFTRVRETLGRPLPANQVVRHRLVEMRRQVEVERHDRDAQLLPIGGGATEVLTDLAARLMGYTA
jgi:alkylation response protein AidB-like acyl-CoA dehydrogenase